VAQEALRNIAKHAQAKTADIRPSRQDRQVVMRVSDDGRGFVANGPAQHQGLGLLSMRERVSMLGGTFDIHASPESGTVAVVSLPAGGRH
jgi:signal transduction histidine kinase